MKVLVTGASGFLGSALCDSLLARGDSVVGLTRDRGKAAQAKPAITWHAVGADPGTAAGGGLRGRRRRRQPARREDRPALDRRGQAADPREPPHGTRNLLGTIAGLERKPGVLVSQSAIGYYGDRGDAVVDEESSPGEGFDSEVVQEWERAAHEAEALGLRLAVVRTGHVLDPGGGFLAEPAAALQARRRRPARGRRAVRLLDPHRRRGRDPALGARRRAGERARSTRPRPTRSPTASSPSRWAGRSAARR